MGDIGEIARRPAERARHPVGRRRIAPVQRLARDLGEQIGHGRSGERRQSGAERLDTHRAIAHRPPARRREDRRDLGKAHGARPGHLVERAGISRQALHLHFPTRAELLIATTRHIDAVRQVDDRLSASRAATGTDRLDAFITAWGGYIPEIHGVAVALMRMAATDTAARLAWDDRMQALRAGCRAAVEALARDGRLDPALTPDTATDLLWTLLSVPTWERLTRECGWSQAAYIGEMCRIARRLLLAQEAG